MSYFFVLNIYLLFKQKKKKKKKKKPNEVQNLLMKAQEG